MKRLTLVSCALACFGLGAAAVRAQGVGRDDASPYERSYRTSFREASIRECVAGVSAPAPAGIDVPAICACSTDWLLERKTLAELKQPPTPEDYTAIKAACFKARP